MNSLVFRKGDASSCLVVDKTWEDIIGKPDDFDELAERLVDMILAAEENGLMNNATTLGQLKNVVNAVLLVPLRKSISRDVPTAVKQKDSILADAFWDEIREINPNFAKLKDALQRAYEMKLKIGEQNPLTTADKLKETKDNFNEAVLKPLLGIIEEE